MKGKERKRATNETKEKDVFLKLTRNINKLRFNLLSLPTSLLLFLSFFYLFIYFFLQHKAICAAVVLFVFFFHHLKALYRLFLISQYFRVKSFECAANLHKAVHREPDSQQHNIFSPFFLFFFRLCRYVQKMSLSGG